MRPALAALAAALVLSCTPATPAAPEAHAPAVVDLSTYDQSCTVDADCTVVNPDPCSHCSCTDGPLAARERARFLEARSAIKCPAPDPVELQDQCGDCVGYLAVCTNGTCEAKPH